MKVNLDKLEELGRLRFPSGAEFEKFIGDRAGVSVKRMLTNLADNYPDADTSRIASFYRTFCEERERALKSLGDIADDQFYDNTRPEYLFQVLGDMLFINEKSGGAQYTDQTYRDFLLKVKNAYLGGSTEANINKSLSDILGIPVQIRQLYLEARKANTPFTIKETHRMVADLFLNDTANEDMQHISVIIQDLYFFTKLIKPAGALFNTNLIWEEELLVAGCRTNGFAMDPNGNTLKYVYSSLPNRLYQLHRLAEVPDDADIIGEDWLPGTVESVDEEAGVVTLVGGSELVLSRSSVFYKYFQGEGSTHRVDLKDLSVGSSIWFFGYEAPGSFNFLNTPKVIQENWYSQFDPAVIGSASFQGSVIVEKDSTGHSVQDKACPSAIQINVHNNTLITQYEDLRDNCDYSTPKLYKAIFNIPSTPSSDGADGSFNIGATLSVSEEANSFSVVNTPLVSSSGELATTADITLYVDNKRVKDGLLSVSPWEGVITLNFLPPAGSEVRFDYLHHDVYPELVSQSFTRNSVVGSAVNGDVTAYTSVIQGSSPVVYFQWPFLPPKYKPEAVASGIPTDYADLDYDLDLTQVENAIYATPATDYSFYGNSMSYQLNEYPVLTLEGDLATEEDILVFIDGVEVLGAIEYVRALLGHVQLNFIPPAGSEVTFQYHYQSKKRDYPFMMDSDQHLAGMVYGVNSSYTLVTDPYPFVGYVGNLNKYSSPAVYGYRYNAFDLGHSSVLNSYDTFRLNDYQKPTANGAYSVGRSKLNNYRVQFSGEYLYDTDKYIEFNDAYLSNGLEALIQLRAGIPPFYRSFTSWASYIYQTAVEESAASTFTTDIEGASDVQATVSVDATPSGLVEYVTIPDYFDKGRAKHYSATTETVTSEGDESIVLSPLCEDRGFDLEVAYKEEYYPNRELRLNDYKDYVERLFSGYLQGDLDATLGSDLVKSTVENWINQQVGGEININLNGNAQSFTITEVVDRNTLRINSPFTGATGNYSYVIPAKLSGKLLGIQGSDLVKSSDMNWLQLRRGTLLTILTGGNSYEFMVAKVLNSDTIRLDRRLPLPGGSYKYEVTSTEVNRADVLLNNVTRYKKLNVKDSMPFYAGFSDNGAYTPWELEIAFPDPDLDPYPRNNFGVPASDPLLTSDVDDQGGRVKFLQSEAEAEKLVKFRNWDQELIVLSMGIIQEPFKESLDDNADSIRVLYWNVANQEFEEYAFRGTLMITSESAGVVAASSYPNALIKLEDYNDTDGLNDSEYILKNTVIRQLLPDNTVDIIAIEEFFRI